MIKIGEYNRMLALKYIGAGMLMIDLESEAVALLPAREVPREMEKGTQWDVFLYQDRENRPVATLEKPHLTLGKFGYLRCIEVNETGAFLDWGISKDLMVPFAAQSKRMVKGLSYIVYLDMDTVTNPVLATSRYHKYLNRD